jgi:hypothetical protein
MERFPRLFLISAISYLLVGVAVGIGVSAGEIDVSAGRFIHVHLNLLGFMGMFIYGVAYHILPRFNATPIKRPQLVGVHFYAVNAGLIGMVLSAWQNGVYAAGPAHALFLTSGIVEAAGIVLFAYNILPVLVEGGRQVVQPAPKPAVQPAKPTPVAQTRQISAEMRVAEILEKWPALADVLVANGFKTLALPSARASFAKTTTIEQACRIHRLDTEALVEKLNAAVNGGKSPEKTAPAVTIQKKAETATAKGKAITRGEQPTADTLVGSLLEVYPESKVVFEKHYGEGCFSCPGQAFETIAQTAGMHGMKTETILGEILTSINGGQQPQTN